MTSRPCTYNITKSKKSKTTARVEFCPYLHNRVLTYTFHQLFFLHDSQTQTSGPWSLPDFRIVSGLSVISFFENYNGFNGFGGGDKDAL